MSVASQQQIADYLMEHTEYKNLVAPDDEMSVFDYYTDTQVIEVKDRGTTNYPDTMLEVSKWNSLVATGKTPLYVVKDRKGITVFDATAVEGAVVQQRWCPKTSEFSDNERVLKDVYLIDFNKGVKYVY